MPNPSSRRALLPRASIWARARRANGGRIGTSRRPGRADYGIVPHMPTAARDYGKRCFRTQADACHRFVSSCKSGNNGLTAT